MTRTGTRLRSRVTRVLVWLLGITALLAVTAWFAGPRLLQGTVRRVAIAEAAKRGVRVEIGALTLRATEARAESVCVWEPDAPVDTPLACVDLATLRFDRPSFWSTRIRPSSLGIHGARVDIAAERGALAEVPNRLADLAARFDDGPRRERSRDPDAPRQERRLEVRATNVTLDVAGHAELPLDALVLDHLDVTRVGREVSAEAHVTVVGLRGLPRGVHAPTGIGLAAHWDGRDAYTVMVQPDDPVAYTTTDGWRAEVASASFTAPYFLSVGGVQVTHASRLDAPVLSFATGLLEVRELTTRVEDLHLVRLEVQHPRVALSLGPDGRPSFPTPASGVPSTPSDEGNNDVGVVTADDDEVRAAVNGGATRPGDEASGRTQRSDPWAGRIWWQKIPQMIVLHELEVTLDREGDPSTRLVLRSPSLRYGLRIFHQQLDVEGQVTLEHAGSPAGEANVEMRWVWARGRLAADLDLRNIRVDSLLRTFRAGDPFVGGTVDLRASFDDHRRPRLDTSGELRWRDGWADIPALKERLALPELSWRWRASRRADTELIEDPVEREPLTFHEGEGRIGDAVFHATPIIYRFRYDRLPVFRRIAMVFEVPDQPAATLVQAIPPALLGPLAGMELAGTWGMSARVDVDAEEVNGRWSLTLREPWEITYRDDALRLVSLPEAVDVRRLNGAMNFTFRGPNDEINRPMHIPAPGPPADMEEVRSSLWVSLRDMSWYLIAIQLYREDGRFFENGGFNWYQWRRVVQEAVHTRRLGRGASTITMQLVKNVFLSHERSLERKFQELILTYWMTRLVPKERILEVYLNVIEWGPGVNGAEEAARYFFGKSARDLSLPEAAWLAAITPAPARRAPQRAAGEPPPWMMRQIRDLMNGIHSRGMITSEELQRGLQQPVRFVTHALYGVAEPTAAEKDEAAEPPDESETQAIEPVPVEIPRRGNPPSLANLPIETRVDALIARSRPLRPGTPAPR